jgi:ComF family protein
LQYQSFVNVRNHIIDIMSNILRKKFWLVLRDILFPEGCLGCGTGLYGHQVVSFCQACLQDVRLIQEPLCTICGKPFGKSAGESHLCSYCLKNKWYFARARSAVYYQEPIAGAVKIFKYSGKMYGLETFAVLTHQYYLQHPAPEPDLILPVPLHPKRLRRRGFNQALVLARKLYPKSKGIIDPHVLERSKWSCVQTGLNVAERRRNVKNAFRVKNPRKIKNKKILLVDDVFTTGATVNECARILLKSKAADVEIFTFARAVGRQ